MFWFCPGVRGHVVYRKLCIHEIHHVMFVCCRIRMLYLVFPTREPPHKALYLLAPLVCCMTFLQTYKGSFCPLKGICTYTMIFSLDFFNTMELQNLCDCYNFLEVRHRYTLLNTCLSLNLSVYLSFLIQSFPTLENEKESILFTLAVSNNA